LIFTAEDPFAAGSGQRVVLGFEGLVVGGDPLSMITPALIRGSDRSLSRSSSGSRTCIPSSRDTVPPPS